MEKQFYYQMQWPRDNLFISCYAHELFNYRYHWHDSDYEIDILLKGRADFCSGQNTYNLEENDVILINPKVWHASFALEENSKALVLRFSDSVFRSLLGKDARLRFQLPPSCGSTRDQESYRKLRCYAAMLLSSMDQSGTFQPLRSRASFEMLLASICETDSQLERVADHNEKSRETVARLLKFIEQHNTEKLSLDDLARYTHYNRTYVSTLFKNTMGINFHDYLTKVRLTNAIFQLAVTDKNVTQIAVDCGFSDLKTFNHRFRDIFGYLPAEYRQRLNLSHIMHLKNQQIYVSPNDPSVAEKLKEYMDIWRTPNQKGAAEH